MIIFDDIVFDSCIPSIVVTIGLVSGDGDEACWLGFGPPCSPGRTPGPKDARTLVHRVEVDTPTDVTAAFVSRYGSIPPEGTPFFVWARASSLSTGAFSEIISLSGVTTCGGTSVLVSSDPNPQDVFVSFGIVAPFGWNVSAHFDDGTTTWMLAITLSGVTGTPLGPFNVDSTDVVTGGLSDLTAGLRSGVFRATSVQTGAIGELAVEVTVHVFTFP